MVNIICIELLMTNIRLIIINKSIYKPYEILVGFLKPNYIYQTFLQCL